VEQPEAPAPLAEGHPRFHQEQPLDRPPAGAGTARERGGRPVVGGMRLKVRRDPPGALVARHRQLQRHLVDPADLVEEQADDVCIRSMTAVERAFAAGVQNQLAEQ
jgi:hypothetical protein